MCDGRVCSCCGFWVLVKEGNWDVPKEVDRFFRECHCAIDDASDRMPQFNRLGDFGAFPSRVDDLHLPSGLLRETIDTGKFISPALAGRRLEKEDNRNHGAYCIISIAGLAMFIL